MKRKGIWKAGILFLMLVFVLSLTQSSVHTVEAASKKKISSYTVKIGSKNVKKKTYSVTEGESVTIKTTIKPSTAKKSVTYKTSNSYIAKVSKTGVVTTRKAGTCKITITIKPKSGKTITTWVKIKVTIPKMEHVTLYNNGVNVWKQTITLDKDQTTKLDLGVSPANAKKSATFSTSNSNVAAVDQAGNVTAKAAGTAKISITVKPRTGKTRKTYVYVNVVETRQYCLLMEKGTSYAYIPDGFSGNMNIVSTNPSIISVNPDNSLNANNYGTCQVIVTCPNKKDYITMTVPDVSGDASGSQLTLPSLNSGNHTFTVYKQAARTYGDCSEFLAQHGCANCNLTNMLIAYAPGYGEATPDSVITGIERQVAGEEAWTENHVTKTLKDQMPVSLYGISRILYAAGVNNIYVQRFDEKNDSAAAQDIVAHLKTGNAVVYEAKDKNRYTGKADGRWTGNFHTLTMLGYFVDGRVIVCDSAGRSWYKPANGYLGGQRFKIVDLSDAMSHMFTCTNTPTSIYFKGTTRAGGYIKVNP